MRIAISGHRSLPDDTAELVEAAIRVRLHTVDGDLVGVSCLADGADQIFAQAVLDAGGDLDVVIPASEYRDGLPAESHAAYDELLGRATHTVRLDYVESTEHAHMAASEVVLGRADRLMAVWDGQPARGYGGTADVVAHARRLGLPIDVVWPPGARRD